MSSNIVIYTNLFTLKNNNVQNNKYVDMYYIWLLYIIKYAKLNANDVCITLIDKETYNFIKDKHIFIILKSKIHNFKIIEYEQPENIKNGILERYNIDKISIDSNEYNPYYIHLDIDVLVINDIHKLFDKSYDNNTTPLLFLKPEGNILESNYYGEVASDNDKKLIMEKCPRMPGFSAGIYAWKNSKNINDFFEFILNKASNYSKELYTVEQPFYNAAIFNYMFKDTKKIKFVVFPNNNIGHNIFNIQSHPDTILLNFCGIPGDDNFHWDKILLQLILTAL